MRKFTFDKLIIFFAFSNFFYSLPTPEFNLLRRQWQNFFFIYLIISAYEFQSEERVANLGWSGCVHQNEKDWVHTKNHDSSRSGERNWERKWSQTWLNIPWSSYQWIFFNKRFFFSVRFWVLIFFSTGRMEFQGSPVALNESLYLSPFYFLDSLIHWAHNTNCTQLPHCSRSIFDRAETLKG